VVAAALLAGQVSLTRSASIDEFDADYVRYLRAKGLSELGVDRRVLRNVLVPVLSMTAAELFSVLVLSVVVIESLLGIEGIGRLTYEAARNNDIPLILGSTMVLIVVGIGGSVACDLASALLDPRSR
jgi:peptide/nickel transport system permease protein